MSDKAEKKQQIGRELSGREVTEYQQRVRGQTLDD